jgi:sugar phosphate isomerase/epimerase
MNPLAVDPISTFGMPPVELIHLSADLGCERTGMTMFTRLKWDPPFYPEFAIRGDRELQRKMAAALKEREITISFVDGFLIEPGKDIRERAEDLEIMAGMGAPLVNTLSVDPDLNRSIDQFGILADLAAAAGMETILELCPGLTISTLPAALAAIEAVGRRDFRLLIDTMHYGRSGARAADVAALDPRLIGYVQISDVNLVPSNPNYMEEATTERLVPGTGELDLVDMLAVIPDDVTISMEVPMYAKARAGIGPHERLGRCVSATRELLAEARSRENA